MYGTNVLLVLPQSTLEIKFFNRLERLALESCSGTSELLEVLGTAFETAKTNSSFQIPKLRELSIRYEAPNDDFRSNLSAFLASFQGLEKLSLLFENASFAEKPATLLRGHGSSLKELVLECRIEPRLNLSHDTSRPFGIGGYTQSLWEDTVQDICQMCPNLEELGTGFPWSDETVRVRNIGDTRFDSANLHFPSSVHRLSQASVLSVQCTFATFRPRLRSFNLGTMPSSNSP